ncbi:hypothetical protein AKJ38_00260 [candidate division MSBL1 archaeon SCGC-AAA259I14]|uniref:ABC transporter domain-containing protein n=1 Tax=candidate division MSBL1 archaeon SCGC-AAA259I14 TaxID=1698268 RepID=A0A133UUJ4_9EURY|nr:hypothetical protein AKJ38_00260 [candidate division MSBL1 archaeon SCGC-AAA259I14]
MKGIKKTFPGVVANDDINFDIKSREIHALLGENGAGKSTLMNILYGHYHPDKGEIFIRGEKAKIRSPKDAHRYGIGMVHQHLKLVPEHSVMENLLVGNPKSGKVLDVKKAKREVLDLCEKYGFDIDLDAKVRQLSAGEKQMVEIINALYRGAQILILDEPTATLTPEETDRLLKSLKTMTEEGNVVIPFITHRLPVVLRISDRITVLRKGKVVDTVKAGEVSEKDLAKMMVGREVLFRIERSEAKKGKKILEVKNLSALSDKGIRAIKNISFTLREGEILGVAGVTGNGQTELVETLAGLRKPVEGKIFYQGEEITKSSVRKRRKMGIEYIPTERVERGTVGEYNLVKNAALTYYLVEGYSKRGLLDFDKIRKKTEALKEEFDVIAPSVDVHADKLSGGNLQKSILARILGRNPKLLILHLPTHGLDVGAQEFVRKRILSARDDGTAVLLISESLDEVMQLSDKIAPIYEGEFVDILPGEEASREKVGSLMSGGE